MVTFLSVIVIFIVGYILYIRNLRKTITYLINEWVEIAGADRYKVEKAFLDNRIKWQDLKKAIELVKKLKNDRLTELEQNILFGIASQIENES